MIDKALASKDLKILVQILPKDYIRTWSLENNLGKNYYSNQNYESFDRKIKNGGKNKSIELKAGDPDIWTMSFSKNPEWEWKNWWQGGSPGTVREVKEDY